MHVRLPCIAAMRDSLLGSGAQLGISLVFLCSLARHGSIHVPALSLYYY
jgi:hypothetical protein